MILRCFSQQEVYEAHKSAQLQLNKTSYCHKQPIAEQFYGDLCKLGWTVIYQLKVTQNK